MKTIDEVLEELGWAIDLTDNALIVMAGFSVSTGDIGRSRDFFNPEYYQADALAEQFLAMMWRLA